MKRIFVYPCSTAIGIEIGKALKDNKHFHVEGGCSDPNFKSEYFKYINPAFFGWDVFSHPYYLHRNLINNIDGGSLIYPAHDEVGYLLGRDKSFRPTFINPIDRVILPSTRTVETCRYKSVTYELLKDLGTPKVYQHWTDIKAGRTYFVKPDSGQGSRGARRVTAEEAIAILGGPVTDLLVMEDLPGNEYTVDCFSDESGVRYMSIRERLVTANGISVSTREIEDHNYEFGLLAQHINQRLKMKNAWFFQTKMDRNLNQVILEVAPRISGNSAYSRYQGVNLPELSIWNHLRKPNEDRLLTIQKTSTVTHMRKELRDIVDLEVPEFNTIIVDWDDTLYNHGVREIQRINPKLIALIVKCKNLNKTVVLATRNENPTILSWLHTHGIAGLFHSIISVPEGTLKSEAFGNLPKRRIAIDDSFSEREDLAKVCAGVYGLDQLDALMENIK